MANARLQAGAAASLAARAKQLNWLQEQAPTQHPAGNVSVETPPPGALSSGGGAEPRAGPSGRSRTPQALGTQLLFTPLPWSLSLSLTVSSPDPSPSSSLSPAHLITTPINYPGREKHCSSRVKSPNHPDNQFPTRVLQSRGSICCQPLLGNRKLSHPSCEGSCEE